MILDRNFEEWEVYASAGPHGRPEVGRLVFRCRSLPRKRPRYRDVEGTRADAERLVGSLSGDELLQLLEEAVEVD